MPFVFLAFIAIVAVFAFAARPAFRALGERWRMSNDTDARLSAVEQTVERIADSFQDTEDRLHYLEQSNTPDALERRMTNLLKSSPKS
jgi:chemotaxis regulatin CheY-phosphate phosphatase CheZ